MLNFGRMTSPSQYGADGRHDWGRDHREGALRKRMGGNGNDRRCRGVRSCHRGFVVRRTEVEGEGFPSASTDPHPKSSSYTGGGGPDLRVRCLST